MAKFITLTLKSGHPVRVNSELITSYSADVASFSEQRGSYVSMYEPYTDPTKYDFFVIETPEQIDALLKGTADTDLLAALGRIADVCNSSADTKAIVAANIALAALAAARGEG